MEVAGPDHVPNLASATDLPILEGRATGTIANAFVEPFPRSILIVRMEEVESEFTDTGIRRRAVDLVGSVIDVCKAAFAIHLRD